MCYEQSFVQIYKALFVAHSLIFHLFTLEYRINGGGENNRGGGGLEMVRYNNHRGGWE